MANMSQLAICHTIRLAKQHEDGWVAHQIGEQVDVVRHEDNRGQKNYIVKGGGQNDKWFSFTGGKHGGEAGAKAKAEEAEQQKKKAKDAEEAAAKAAAAAAAASATATPPHPQPLPAYMIPVSDVSSDDDL